MGDIPPFEFAFIDADHAYEAAKQDFQNCWEKLKSGGIIAMHDTASWPDLAKLIDELRAEHQMIEFFRDEDLTLIQKPATKLVPFARAVKNWGLTD